MHVCAGLALAQGQLDEAADWLARADDDCRWLGHPRRLMTDSRMAHMLIDALFGRAGPALAAAQAAEDDFARGALSNRLAHRADLLFVQCRARWILGDEAGVRALDAEMQRVANHHEWRIAPGYRQCSQAMVAMFDARWDEAEALLRPLADDINRCGLFPAAQAQWMLADVQVRRGRTALAAAALRPWFEASRCHGEVGTAWLAGPAVLSRLAAVDWGAHLPHGDQVLMRRLARQLALAQRSGGAPAEPVNAPPCDRLAHCGLTEREREVLLRVAAGDSNKLIARAFELSPHTVKRHVANILDKLGAQSRGQAAAAWRSAQPH